MVCTTPRRLSPRGSVISTTLSWPSLNFSSILFHLLVVVVVVIVAVICLFYRREVLRESHALHNAIEGKNRKKSEGNDN